MAANERFENQVSKWLEESAPARLPERVLNATFERTRTSRQHAGWRALLEKRHGMLRFTAALGSAAFLVIAVVMAFNFYANRQGIGVGPSPTAPDPRTPYLGDWFASANAADGGRDTMKVSASADGSVEIVLHDVRAFYPLITNDSGLFVSVCSGGSTLTGTGNMRGATLVFSAPEFACNDGGQPIAGPSFWAPLDEVLRGLTFTYDPAGDTLSDSFGSHWDREGAQLRPSPTPVSPTDPVVTALLNGFLDARVAGVGAQQYLGVPEEEVPLLYATTSGDMYDRAQYQQVPGIEWPGGRLGFKVRLFAADTVVEQLIFLDNRAAPLALGYLPDAFGADIAPTTENGQPVAKLFSTLDDQVTLRVAYPWSGWRYAASPYGYDQVAIGLITAGNGPAVDQHDDSNRFEFVADPVWVDTDCHQGPAHTDAQGLADVIRSDTGLEATAPVSVTVGGTDALMTDVKIPAGAPLCIPSTDGGDPNYGLGLLYNVFDPSGPPYFDSSKGLFLKGVATGQSMRLYLVNVPQGLSMRLLVVAIIAPEADFDQTVEAAQSVLDTIEFHAR